MNQHRENKYGELKSKVSVSFVYQTNMAFRSQSPFTITGPGIPSGTTNQSVGFTSTLPNGIGLMRVIDNGTIVINALHQLNKIISVGRNNVVMGILHIRFNRIVINGEYVFGASDFYGQFGQGTLMYPSTQRSMPLFVTSEFCHFEFESEPVIVQLEASIDSGLFLSLVFSRRVLAFARYDQSSLTMTLVQILRSVAFTEIRQMLGMSEMIERYLGQPGLRAVNSRNNRRQQLAANVESVQPATLHGPVPFENPLRDALIESVQPAMLHGSVPFENPLRDARIEIVQPSMLRCRGRALSRGVTLYLPNSKIRIHPVFDFRSEIDDHNEKVQRQRRQPATSLNGQPPSFGRILNRVRRAINLSLMEYSLFAAKDKIEENTIHPDFDFADDGETTHRGELLHQTIKSQFW